MIGYQDLEDRIASLERTVRPIGVGDELVVGDLTVLGSIRPNIIESLNFNDTGYNAISNIHSRIHLIGDYRGGTGTQESAGMRQVVNYYGDGFIDVYHAKGNLYSDDSGDPGEVGLFTGTAIATSGSEGNIIGLTISVERASGAVANPYVYGCDVRIQLDEADPGGSELTAAYYAITKGTVAPDALFMGRQLSGKAAAAIGLDLDGGSVYGTAAIQLPDDHATTSGIRWGTDTLLYNPAANKLQTPDIFTALYLEMDGSGETRLNWNESGTWRYRMAYSTTNNRWYMMSTDGDGGGTDTELIRIPDGQTTIDANTTWDDNAFDWVCSECGWHSEAKHERCPECGGKVEWQDDAMLMNSVVKSPGKAGDLPTPLLRRLEQLGIVNTYGTLEKAPGEREVFVSLSRAHWFSWSAIAQLWRRVEALEGIVP